MAIYNTYRPHTFDDVIEQGHVVQTLKQAIERNIISHAYLFTGPRGTGKTTLGRIFAHAVNCTPRKDFTPSDKNVCEEILAGNALDVIEIDAASHTSVENIRDIRETIALPPSRAHYKVYIIDEAHMLSLAAWNAFLKTLEEPPAHALFIFATTEVHKVPETILSRVQRFDLNRISVTAISKKLLRIAQSEGVALDKESATMIASASAGSMRDAESLLAQVMAFSTAKISTDAVRTILGITQRSTVFDLIEYITKRDTVAALSVLADITTSGYNLTTFATALLSLLRHMLLGSVSRDLLTQVHHLYDKQEQKRLTELAKTQPRRIIAIIDALTTARATIPQSAIPELPLETAIVRLTVADCNTPRGNMPKGGDVSQRTQDIETQNHNTHINQNESDLLRALTQQWPKVIAAIHASNAPFATLLRHSAPHTITKNTLTLTTPNALLIEKLHDSTFQLTLQNAIATICKKRFTIVAHAIDGAPSSSTIANAMQLMRGGRIVGSA